MKKKKFYFAMIVITPIILCTLMYIALAFYYKASFSFGTWINGIYCTGKSVEEINEELCKKAVGKTFTIEGRDGLKEVLNLEKIHYQEDFITPLTKMKESQNPFLWGENLFVSKSQVLIPVISYDKNLFKKELQKYSFMNTNSKNVTPRIEILKTSSGYEMYDNRTVLVDPDKTMLKIENAIQDYEHSIDLAVLNCYESFEETPETKEKYRLWEKVNQFQSFHMQYLFGDNIEVLDSSIVSGWIKKDADDEFMLDESGQLVLDESGIQTFIATLASKYDTVGAIRQFHSTRGDLITIEGGTYGNKLDQKAEVQYLLQAFAEHNESDRVPMYEKTAKKQGKDDIGDTYIEIDMTKQTMYYYLNGVLQLETPVVTGNTSLKRGTPERVCYVYAKQKNRILRGPGYASHVNFWMPVNGNIGIHDALWRKNFGGEIYKTAGSHGCINTPYEQMERLYDMVEIETPVIIFY